MSRARRSSFVSDLVTDISIELKSQPVKTARLILAVALSIGALLASVGISRNAAHQIDADLAASTIRLVTVTASEAAISEQSEQSQKSETALGQDVPSSSEDFFPPDTQQRLEKLDSVSTAGIMLNLTVIQSPEVTRPEIGISNPAQAPGAQRIWGITSGYLETKEIELSHGKPDLRNSDLNVVYLGTSAAENLGVPITSDTTGINVTIGGRWHSVAGFLPEGSEFDTGLVIPYAHASKIVGSNLTATVLIKAELGAGSQVSQAAAHVIKPEAPQKLAVSQVVSADGARDNVATQMARQATWVGIFLIVLTTLLIANSMIVAVTARTAEIGVRRALGSSKSAVAAVFWFEGALIGLLGGAGGSAVTAWVIVIVAWFSGWTAIISPVWIALGPLLGAAVGLVGSVYPALRAARIRPAIAVRSN